MQIIDWFMHRHCLFLQMSGGHPCRFAMAASTASAWGGSEPDTSFISHFLIYFLLILLFNSKERRENDGWCCVEVFGAPPAASWWYSKEPFDCSLFPVQFHYSPVVHFTPSNFPFTVHGRPFSSFLPHLAQVTLQPLSKQVSFCVLSAYLTITFHPTYPVYLYLSLLTH